MWFRGRRSEYARLGLVQKGDPPEPLPLKTSVGSFDLRYGTSHPGHLLDIRVCVHRGKPRRDDDWDDDHWEEKVANVRDLTNLLVHVGIPEDEAEVAARSRFGEAVRYIREGWPDFDLLVEPDEQSLA